jgi:hypothetical protein
MPATTVAITGNPGFVAGFEDDGHTARRVDVETADAVPATPAEA